MTGLVSPYALLCASRPKPAPTTVTPYDLYSCMQDVAVHEKQSSMSPPVIREQEPGVVTTKEYSPVPPERRTHYVSDIHAKHGSAGRRVSYVHHPLE